MPEILGFAFVKDYVLNVRFDDGVERAIDFEPILIGPLFGPLRDPRLFRQVRIDPNLGTLVWPTGADIDPSVLYDWPRQVDAIVQRRRQRWAVDYSEQGSRERFDGVLQKVAEANPEPYEADRPPEETDHETE
ncbi:DUF2442 domain-containing protein [Candidatus Amarolinea aalborgensis]|jgi:hypothetical protein|uniref:DUF2442 domain-containing protein n=1 Tax=Candidatus Amarolinea aalborgensis TaxID=2249329 RepID=UPI003BF992AC